MQQAMLTKVFEEKPLIFLDCEMTGGCDPHNRLLDLGYVKAFLRGLVGYEEIEARVRVSQQDIKRASKRALRVVGYNEREWRTARDVELVLGDLAAATEGCVPVLWSGHCDLLILDEEAERLGMAPLFPLGYIELQDWAQSRFGWSDKPSLHRMADRFKIPYARKHRGLDDAYITFELFRMLWRYNFSEMWEALPRFTWSEYDHLSDSIVLPDQVFDERLSELFPFVVTDRMREVLVAKRAALKRT